MKTIKPRLIVLAILYAIFVLLAFMVIQEKTAAFDAAAYTWIARYISPLRTEMMTLAADFGDVAAVIALCVVLLLLPFTRGYFGLPVTLNAIITASSNEFIKRIVARPRPEILRLAEETNFSFSSGHAMNNAALYAMLAMLVFRCTTKKSYRIPALAAAFLFPFLIGLSRVYLGVHYASDVLAGWILGLAIALTMDLVFSLFERRHRPKVRYYGD